MIKWEPINEVALFSNKELLVCVTSGDGVKQISSATYSYLAQEITLPCGLRFYSRPPYEQKPSAYYKGFRITHAVEEVNYPKTYEDIVNDLLSERNSGPRELKLGQAILSAVKEYCKTK